MHGTGTRDINVQHSIKQATTVERMALLHGHADKTKYYKRKIRNVRDTENTTIGEETDESDMSNYRIVRINRNIFDTDCEIQRDGEIIHSRYRNTNIKNGGGQQKVVKISLSI